MADNERVISTVFKADISNFSASTQQLSRYVNTVNSEFKNATASMDKWNDNTDGLKAKLTQLNKVLDAEEQKLVKLSDAYAEMEKEGKENTRAAQELLIKINNQSAKVQECKKNIDFYTDSLKELEDAGVKTKDELNELNAKLDDQKQAAKDLGGGIMTGAAAGVAGFAAACAGALGTLSSIVEETKELRTQMGQLETAFTQNGHSVETSKKTFDDLYAVMGDNGAATEAALHLGEFAKNEKELQDLTLSLTGAYARFSSSIPLENLAEGVNTTLSLNQANAGMIDAIEFAGGNVEEFNEKLQSLNTEEEKRAFILETLNGEYAKAGETYKEVNGEVMAANDAQNQYNQTMAALGEKAQPAITSFKTAMATALQEVTNKFTAADIEGLIGGITNAITWLTTNALPPAMTAITWVLDNINWLAPLLGGIVGTIGAISAGMKIYNGVMTIAKTVQLAFNLAMKANPIGLVVTAVTLLIGAFTLLWNKCEGFRNFFKGFVNFIIGGVNKVIGGLNKVKFDIPDWVPVIGGKEFGFNIKEIPLMAKGGIVDKPTLAMVGEAGKEAVMPLENNTQWIDKLADKLSTKGAGNVSYTINNTFERMETSRLALHQANLETKRILRGGY